MVQDKFLSGCVEPNVFMIMRVHPAGYLSLSTPRRWLVHHAANQMDYLGFGIPDEFVIGYGLDYDDYYWNLPEIAVLKVD